MKTTTDTYIDSVTILAAHFYQELQKKGPKSFNISFSQSSLGQKPTPI